MNPADENTREQTLVARRMEAFAALAEHLAVPNDLATLCAQVLVSLRDDVEAMAVYLVEEDRRLTLLLHEGFRMPPPERAADAWELCGLDPDHAGERNADAVVRIFATGTESPAWVGEHAPALAQVPFGGREPGQRRGVVVFVLRRADHLPSLAALLELVMHRLAQALAREAAPRAGPGAGAAGRIRVLLVDDDQLLAAYVRRILERAGFAFHAAHNAREGFELAISTEPDVILIDKVMPDLDGIKLLRKMRGNDMLSTVPVIMLSGYADETARVAALGAGADDFVVKPFSAKDLVARIEANVRLVRLRHDAVWRQSELLRLRQSQQELRTLLDTVQRVRDDERRRLAREVHDQLGQILTAVKIDLRLLAGRIAAPGEPTPACDILAELNAGLSGVDLAIAAVQDIAALLRPPELEEGGLVAALRWQAAELQRRAGIACSVEFDPTNYVEQSPFVSGELLRICQEALTNVLRHAGATRVLIQVAMRNTSLLVRICDNGTGVPEGRQHDPASLGLKGMHERAASIRARLRVRGRPGLGTVVAIRRRQAQR
ncbi:response regulator [Massilia sp. 9I]|uniref:ATP-binding response regulator n=1 Tax=Massilia sp. 9I TaxID=2653152 RepID=UPI0012F3BBF4|nr:response regulator [Massilia sp. 9I]VXC12652.1 PAS domain S-box protein [Massilia sp. 9I]